MCAMVRLYYNLSYAVLHILLSQLDTYPKLEGSEIIKPVSFMG